MAEARRIDRLEELLAVLPLRAVEACSARNWLSNARELLSEGELGAARFQIAAVSRKLARRDPVQGLGGRAAGIFSPPRTAS